MHAHNERLQSLRGIAAMMVLFGHAAYLVPFEVNHAFAIEALIFQAQSAVVFFFVLSGFVLTMSLNRMLADGRGLVLVRYAIARVGRLLPVFWIAIVVGAVSQAVSAMHPLPNMGPGWYAMTNAGAPTIGQVIDAMWHLSRSFNIPLWSIQVEFWMIVVLPLIVLIMRRTSLLVDLAIAVALCVFGRIMLVPGLDFAPLAYCYAFWCGALLPKLLDALGRYRPNLCSGITAVSAFALAIYIERKTASGFNYYTKLILDGPLSMPIVAWAWTAPLSTSSAARILTRRPLVWFGNVSYSFYAYGQQSLILVAMPLCLVLPAWVVTTSWGVFAITIVVPIITTVLLLPLCAISYTYVERPGIRAAARIAAMFRSELAVPAAQSISEFPRAVRADAVIE